jgi:hypothetical protein
VAASALNAAHSTLPLRKVSEQLMPYTTQLVVLAESPFHYNAGQRPSTLASSCLQICALEAGQH